MALFLDMVMKMMEQWALTLQHGSNDKTCVEEESIYDFWEAGLTHAV
jgi:hypothetical protein